MKNELVNKINKVDDEIEQLINDKKSLERDVVNLTKHNDLKKQFDAEFIFQHGEKLIDETNLLRKKRNELKQTLINDIIEIDNSKKDDDLKIISMEGLLEIKEMLLNKKSERKKRMFNFFKYKTK